MLLLAIFLLANFEILIIATGSKAGIQEEHACYCHHCDEGESSGCACKPLAADDDAFNTKDMKLHNGLQLRACGSFLKNSYLVDFHLPFYQNPCSTSSLFSAYPSNESQWAGRVVRPWTAKFTTRLFRPPEILLGILLPAEHSGRDIINIVLRRKGILNQRLI